MKKYDVKYAVEPVYEKNSKTHSKLLYGYVVSKCYEIENNNGHVVLFPYALDRKTYSLALKRTPSIAKVGFNTDTVNSVFDDYEMAKIMCKVKNFKVNSGRNRKWLSTLERLEELVNENTTDMKITKKECIKTKSL